MNGRINHEEATPESRIAAVAKALCEQMRAKFPGRDPDYADFRDALRPFITREILKARISEARSCSGTALTERIRVLAEELATLKFPDEFDVEAKQRRFITGEL